MFASVEGWMIRGLESVQQEPRSEIVIFLQTQVRLSHFVQTRPARDDILTVSHLSIHCCFMSPLFGTMLVFFNYFQFFYLTVLFQGFYVALRKILKKF